MTAFERIPDLMLSPLDGKGDEAWLNSPGGQWSPAQIVDHVATAIERSVGAFAGRKEHPPMQRRPRTMFQRVGTFVIFTFGRFPPGRKAPEATTPAAHPERAATEHKLRRAVASFAALESDLAHRARDLFAKHPVLGDLTMSEFKTFHVRHAEHHTRQLLERLP